MPRRLKPREPVTPRAELVSQLTSLALLGVDGRRFLERVVPLCKGDVVVLGKLRLVSLHVAVERLSALASEERADNGDDGADVLEPVDDPEPRNVDDVLRAVGLRRVS